MGPGGAIGFTQRLESTKAKIDFYRYFRLPCNYTINPGMKYKKKALNGQNICSERLKQLAGSSFKGIEEKVNKVFKSFVKIQTKLQVDQNTDNTSPISQSHLKVIIEGGDIQQTVIIAQLSFKRTKRGIRREG